MNSKIYNFYVMKNQSYLATFLVVLSTDFSLTLVALKIHGGFLDVQILSRTIFPIILGVIIPYWFPINAGHFFGEKLRTSKKGINKGSCILF